MNAQTLFQSNTQHTQGGKDAKARRAQDMQHGVLCATSFLGYAYSHGAHTARTGKNSCISG
eukprot:scaffold86439_cov29-Tisochrysis_lutea.AAC.1